jgi:hypothetical protein
VGRYLVDVTREATPWGEEVSYKVQSFGLQGSTLNVRMLRGAFPAKDVSQTRDVA